MIKLNEIYICEKCGNIVEVIGEGEGELICCGEPMKVLTENTVDAAVEKHVPVVEETAEGILVKVGEVAHPMEEKHWITMIEVITNCGMVLRRHLNPGDKPEAVFPVKMADVAKVREYCNLHGLWVK